MSSKVFHHVHKDPEVSRLKSSSLHISKKSSCNHVKLPSVGDSSQNNDELTRNQEKVETDMKAFLSLIELKKNLLNDHDQSAVDKAKSIQVRKKALSSSNVTNAIKSTQRTQVCNVKDILRSTFAADHNSSHREDLHDLIPLLRERPSSSNRRTLDSPMSVLYRLESTKTSFRVKDYDDIEIDLSRDSVDQTAASAVHLDDSQLLEDINRTRTCRTSTAENAWDKPLEVVVDESDDLYFGANAKMSFFKLYQSLATSSCGRTSASEVVSLGRNGPSVFSPIKRNSPERLCNYDSVLSENQTPSRSPRSPSAFALPLLASPVRDSTRETSDVEGDPDVDLSFLDALDSPRHKFILHILQENTMTPLPILFRSRKDDVTLNLSHRALRDDYLVFLSDVIGELPGLRKLDMTDNCLTDKGIRAVVKAMNSQRHLIEINLSENKCSLASALEIASYISSSRCPLRVLGLSKSSIDDMSMRKLMDGVKANGSLLHLDLSHNLVGGGSEMGMNTQSAKTGGAAIADALKSNNTLTFLNLAWNKLGPLSACMIGEALQTNQTLLELRLAYNSVKDEGAEIIGFALNENETIQVLDLSYAGIASMGCMMLSMGLRKNRSIRLLDMSGNPIGEDGGRFLLQTFNYYSGDREILMRSCSMETSIPGSSGGESQSLFYPSGSYTFDCKKPLSRGIVTFLLSVAATRRGCQFKNLTYQLPSPGAGKMPKVPVVLARPSNPASVMGQSYGPWTISSPRPKWQKCVEQISGR